jgi:hypothetical protein
MTEKIGMSKTKIALLSVTALVLIMLFVLGATGNLNPKTDPLDAFTVSKTCTFLQVEPPMAFCDDGTQYSVILVNPLATGQ